MAGRRPFARREPSPRRTGRRRWVLISGKACGPRREEATAAPAEVVWSLMPARALWGGGFAWAHPLAKHTQPLATSLPPGRARTRPEAPPRAERRAFSGDPATLGALLLPKTASAHRTRGASGTRRSARPLSGGGRECSIPRAPRASRDRGGVAV
jgi:hypothetical protein